MAAYIVCRAWSRRADGLLLPTCFDLAHGSVRWARRGRVSHPRKHGLRRARGSFQSLGHPRLHGAWPISRPTPTVWISGPLTARLLAGLASFCSQLAAHSSFGRCSSLATRFSGLAAIQPGHQLATTGIYSIARHPRYLGLVVSLLGWGLAFRSGVGVLVTVLLIASRRTDARRGMTFADAV